MNLDKAWAFDTEVFPNVFVLVARSLADEKLYHKYVISEWQDDYEAIKQFLKTKPTLCGFNSIGFDGQIIELLWRSEKPLSAKEIYDFVDEFMKKKDIDRFHLPYSEWDLSFAHCDLFLINHLNRAKEGVDGQAGTGMTSLKWLEFSMRNDRMIDMPFPVGSYISASNVSKLVAYCKEDTDVTALFFFKSEKLIEQRQRLIDKYKQNRVMNMSNAAIGEFIIKMGLKAAGFTDKQLKATIKRDNIAAKDVLLDYIRFSSPEFNGVFEKFKSTVFEDVSNKGIKGVFREEVVFNDMPIVFGTGGFHGCYKSGVYKPDDEYMIVSADADSYYSSVAIANDFYPGHLGKKFCEVYKGIKEERSTYPKTDSLNRSFKDAQVCVYGKSNNKYSFLYDCQYTLSITLNGQLLLTMLAEALNDIGRLLLCNTDGIEMKIHKSKLKEFYDICSEWELLTGLSLEYTTYSLMAIRDVNSYLAVNDKGKIKRKGIFRTYHDYTELNDNGTHAYDENPSGTIIPEALCEYFVNQVPPESTIGECNSIYPFLYGIKGQKGYDYWFITANDEGVIDIEKRTEKAIRFYIKKKGANIYKFWKDDRKANISAVKRGQLVETAMSISKNGEIISIRKGKKGEPSTTVVNYEPDRQYYISECYKLIQAIESGMELNEESLTLSLVVEED